MGFIVLIIKMLVLVVACPIFPMKFQFFQLENWKNVGKLEIGGRKQRDRAATRGYALGHYHT